jgi:hypothetical protein
MSTATEKTYTVEGMTCGHCELSVREEVEEVKGVTPCRPTTTPAGSWSPARTSTTRPSAPPSPPRPAIE